jgi:hypothetical protein
MMASPCNRDNPYPDETELAVLHTKWEVKYMTASQVCRAKQGILVFPPQKEVHFYPALSGMGLTESSIRRLRLGENPSECGRCESKGFNEKEPT